jgi:hypothetical protein
MHTRLELKSPYVEEFEGPAGLVHRYGIQLIPGSCRELAAPNQGLP